jgi:hypothetical protein
MTPNLAKGCSLSEVATDILAKALVRLWKTSTIRGTIVL